MLDGAALVDPAVADLDAFFWTQDTVDCSSASTGSSVFDFNGDGRAEVLYGDEHSFRIYAGATGDVLFETCNTNGTIRELPVVADVDNDGQADIVVVGNARHRACTDDPTRRISGLRVFGSAAGTWVRTRRVWNQHSYHVTNVEEDGSIPAREVPNWMTEGLNNFRQNRQPGNELAAVDLVLSLAPRCAGETAIVATVRNVGEGVMPPGATVRLTMGSSTAPGDVIGTATTTLTLYPAQAEELAFPVTSPDILSGVAPIHGVVEVPADVPECRPDNNDASELSRSCLI